MARAYFVHPRDHLFCFRLLAIKIVATHIGIESQLVVIIVVDFVLVLILFRNLAEDFKGFLILGAVDFVKLFVHWYVPFQVCIHIIMHICALVNQLLTYNRLEKD